MEATPDILQISLFLHTIKVGSSEFFQKSMKSNQTKINYIFDVHFLSFSVLSDLVDPLVFSVC